MSASRRMTLNLSQRAGVALDEILASTGGTKTDVINRALQLYWLVEQATSNGGDLYVRPVPDAELELVRIL